jgi:phospholipid transport system substrate-binding protein
MRTIFRNLAVSLLGLSLFWGSAAAQGGDDLKAPDVLVKETIEKVLSELRQRQSEIDEDPSVVFGIVREEVLPHFDFPLISRFVLAQHWRKASPEQRERFMEEFRTLLTRTYGTSLAEYSGQTVEYLPMTSDADSGRVVVKTEIQQSDGPSIPMSYRLHKTDEGWKVFDVIVEGASYVQTYRSEYGSLAASQGMDALIERLAKKNREKDAS